MRFHVIIQIRVDAFTRHEFTRHFKRLSEAKDCYEDLLGVPSIVSMYLYDIREATPLQSFARVTSTEIIDA